MQNIKLIITTITIIIIIIIALLLSFLFTKNVTQTTTLASTKSHQTTTTNPVKIYTDGMPQIRFAREQDLKASNYSIFKRQSEKGDLDPNSPPFDNLEPSELLTRLNYIYYATANPYEFISYADFKTDADKRVERDGSSLSSQDPFYAKYNAKYYPQLSKNLLDTRDCLNGGNSTDSCFQTPQLFANLAASSASKAKEAFTNADEKPKPTSILSQGLNQINKVFLQDVTQTIKEGFSNPMILDAEVRHLPIMYRNAPSGQDKILDAISNEYIRIDDSDKTCRNCKLAVCKDDYCFLQNQLFM